MTALDTPLSHVLRAYLHQDYDLEYGSVEDALKAYRDDASGGERRLVLEEMATLLATQADDAALYRALRARGFIFSPPHAREWLLRAREILDVKDSEEERDR